MKSFEGLVISQMHPNFLFGSLLMVLLALTGNTLALQCWECDNDPSLKIRGWPTCQVDADEDSTCTFDASEDPFCATIVSEDGSKIKLKTCFNKTFLDPAKMKVDECKILEESDMAQALTAVGVAVLRPSGRFSSDLGEKLQVCLCKGEKCNAGTKLPFGVTKSSSSSVGVIVVHSSSVVAAILAFLVSGF